MYCECWYSVFKQRIWCSNRESAVDSCRSVTWCPLTAAIVVSQCQTELNYIERHTFGHSCVGCFNIQNEDLTSETKVMHCALSAPSCRLQVSYVVAMHSERWKQSRRQLAGWMECLGMSDELIDSPRVFRSWQPSVDVHPCEKVIGIFFRHKFFIIYFLPFVLVFIHDICEVVNINCVNFCWISIIGYASVTFWKR